MNNRHEKLLEKAIFIKNDVTSRIVPNVLNHVILVAASLMVLLATLSNPDNHNILLFRALLCTLLLAIFLGVFCISIVAFDFYKLSIKASAEVIESIQKKREPAPYINSGKTFYMLIVFSFVGSLLSFLSSLVLLLIFAWNFKH